ILNPIKYLDPIALIALSQTSKFFRQCINPTPHEFRQRLLAMESLPEFSDYRDQVHFDRDEWRAESLLCLLVIRDTQPWHGGRYACFGRMKLLQYDMFENLDWVEAPLTKPWPGNDEWNKLLVTSW
ncbi:hypothetical protein QBC38DRAFT_326068, partial [Podospora fimiseda]